MKKSIGDNQMQLEILFEGEEDMHPEQLENKQAKMIMKIYKEFPHALWDKTKKGFRVLI